MFVAKLPPASHAKIGERPLAQFHVEGGRYAARATNVAALGFGWIVSVFLMAGCNDSQAGGQDMPKPAPELAQAAPSRARTSKPNPRAGMPIRTRAEYERVRSKNGGKVD